MPKTRIEAAMLQRLAQDAATGVKNDLSIKAECVYLGQATGPDLNRSHIREPSEWILEEGVWPSRQARAYAWRWAGGIDVVEQRCDNAQR